MKNKKVHRKLRTVVTHRAGVQYFRVLTRKKKVRDECMLSKFDFFFSLNQCSVLSLRRVYKEKGSQPVCVCFRTYLSVCEFSVFLSVRRMYKFVCVFYSGCTW